MRAFILKVKPALTIWYHQPLDEVYGWDPHVAVLKRYARLSGLPYHRLAAPPGAATRWERNRFPHGVHFVAEFPAGPHLAAATAAATRGQCSCSRRAGRRVVPCCSPATRSPTRASGLAPREPVALRELVAEEPLLLLFYLFDWSAT